MGDGRSIELVRFWLMIALLSAGLSCVSPEALPSADSVYVNGRIWTGDPGQPWAEALAVSGDRLAAVGTDSRIQGHIGTSTRVTDLQGRLVTPGFNDAHLHFLVVEQAELQEAGDLADLQRRLAEFAGAHPDRAWVMGRGWVYTQFPDRVPHRRYLDAVIPDRPVFVRDRDGHAGLANSLALRLAGVDRSTPAVAGGVIERDAGGEPTGLLKEAATRLVSGKIPPPDEEELYGALLQRLEQAAALGLTSVQNASPIDLPVWERARAAGRLTLRVYAALPMRKDISDEELAKYRDLRSRYTGPWIKYGSIKGMLDGTVDSKTAAMLEPYVGGGTGLPFWTQEDLNRTVAQFDAEGFQVLLHAIGDRAIGMALDAFEQAAAQNQTGGRRHRVEHIEVPALADLPRFARLGVIASTQAIFADPDEATLGNYAVVLGPERAGRSNAFRLFDDAGAIQAFGSDWPVFPMDPLKGMWAAVSRTTLEGNPPGGWYPENFIPVEAALRHFTRDSAYASFDEEVKGTLEPGKLADFVALSQNILESPVESLRDCRVLLTVVGGSPVFRSDEFH